MGGEVMAKKPTGGPVTKVYGHSDDCIEVEGHLEDEFSSFDKASHLYFSDGTILRCEYGANDKAQWEIKPVKIGTVGPGNVVRSKATDEDANFTDTVEIHGNLLWVECWENADGPDFDELVERIRGLIDNRSLDELERDQLLAIYRALMKR
jgi:hypothetical protein